jgi:hypothetical protein
MALTRFRRIGLPLVAAIAVSAAVAAPAIATPGLVSGIGTYKTWAEAQKAAGFKLMKPSVTYGLPNVGHVIVSVCEVQGETKKRVVTVSYGNFNAHNLGLTQNNSAGPCGNANEGTYLATYKLHGIKAKLYGFCDILGAPSCNSAKVELWLTWKNKSVYLVASSYNESRSRLVHFANTLRKA